jgi:hypothetical protein
MKAFLRNFVFFLVASACCVPFEGARAQAGQLAGFVLVNAVGSKSPIMASYNGKAVLMEPGLSQGSATSGLGVQSGSGTLSVSHPDLGTAEAPLEISPGTTPIVIAYAEMEPAKPDVPPKRKLALKMLQAAASKSPQFRVLYSADPKSAPAKLSLNKEEVALAPWRVKTIPGSSLDIVSDKTSVDSTTLEQPESCAVFVARGEDGGLFAVFVPEIIYSW